MFELFLAGLLWELWWVSIFAATLAANRLSKRLDQLCHHGCRSLRQMTEKSQVKHTSKWTLQKGGMCLVWEWSVRWMCAPVFRGTSLNLYLANYFGSYQKRQRLEYLVVPTPQQSLKGSLLVLFGPWRYIDSITVSLSTKSIRRQDPNTYSDTEVRALSTWRGF